MRGKVFNGEKKQKYCSSKCFGSSIRKRIKTQCAWCGKEIEVIEFNYKNYKTNHCSNQHRAFSSTTNRGYKVKQIAAELFNIVWNNEISYLLGIIATDGTLNKNRKLIKIVSADKSYLQKLSEIVIKITGRTQPIHHGTTKFRNKIYNYYSLQFTSNALYDFCIEIGITPNKTYMMSEAILNDGSFGNVTVVD
ncbi:hypothetical protein [Evansella halocellulosilytica]|uniref:hypothetical protein n=1 Tax=Evansella halocellulosilytica TaxID=2011013 RepID=UPI0011559548|nr:hypothetical protein [Evansella halocellulosilytica]